MTFPPTYNPAEVEKHWYADWESRGAFKPDLNAPEGPFTIVIPPPNVTGILHMGHALNNTLQDILIRWKRMQGHAVLWVPGTDHAGIATQNVVERELAKEKVTRQQLGRDQFIQRVWTWKEKYGSTIVHQLRRLGSSCDWSRERFTMDEGLSKAVQTAFKGLYDQGLIYRGFRIVNWCSRCQTALSDEEVVHEEVKGHLWHILYPVRPEPDVPLRQAQGERPSRRRNDGVVVATTRPETLLGDVAVAVNPKDDRYRGLVGTSVELPLCDRSIPIISDDAVDSTFGTGAVKITPAHDPVDFEIARRHLELIPKAAPRQDWTSIPINIMMPDGLMTNVPATYVALDRFECRKRVVADLEGKGLLVKVEDYSHSIGHCYRCKTVIEPRLSPQWFVKMEPLAKLGIEAVEKDGMRFVPDRWTKVYLDWLNNIRDWCISRQIWWGHRIPVWYCIQCEGDNLILNLDPDYKVPPKVISSTESFTGVWNSERLVRVGLGGAFRIDPSVLNHVQSYEADEKYSRPIVSVEPPKSCPQCGSKNFFQDPDVLDTWFSSWLWPFSTLGWPEQTKDLNTFYPTFVLVTGQDIIFFWVARMVMAGKFFLGKIPFRDVYIHGIIRVEGGKKMSKSLGNIIDPLEIIDRMGADALRFSLTRMTSEGQDLYLSEEKFLLGRNFANKLWNASRLILEGKREKAGEPIPFNARFMTVPDRWILSRFQQVIQAVTDALEDFHFNGATKNLYHFIWHEFCDWYLEIAKLQRECKDPAVVHNTDQILLTVLEGTLRLLHPFMPFITEELWQRTRHCEDRDSAPVIARARSARSNPPDGFGTGSAILIMTAQWPEPTQAWVDPEAEEIFGRLQSVITEVRNIRATFRVPVKEKVNLLIQGAIGTDLLKEYEELIRRFGAVDQVSVELKVKRPSGSVVTHLPAAAVCDSWDLIVPLAGLVDLAVERKRIEKEVHDLETRAKSKRGRLEDPAFRSKAPADVVAEEEESLKELETQMGKWADSLKQIK